MQGWLQPEGPEPVSTYWWRRLAVLAVVGLIAAGIVWAVTRLTASEPSGTITPAVTNSAAPSSAKPTASRAATKASTKPSVAASPSPSAKTGAPPTSATPKATSTGPQPCDPASLRVTVSGPAEVVTQAEMKITLSLINGSADTCLVKPKADTYSLVVTSGTDQIWTSDHCPTWLGRLPTKLLKPEQAVEWTTAWPTRRSSPNCGLREDVLKPGWYIATATLKGATPATQRVKLVAG